MSGRQSVEVKSNHCYLIRKLLVCIRSCPKSVLIYKFLILDTYHPDALHLREQGCENLWPFFGAERGPRAKLFGKLF